MQQIQIFADNDPDVLEQRLNAWLKKHRPHVLARRLESDGTDYAYNLVVRYCPELQTKWFFSDDIVEIQEQINQWFEEVKPQVISEQMVVDGAEWVYVYVFWYC